VYAGGLDAIGGEPLGQPVRHSEKFQGVQDIDLIKIDSKTSNFKKRILWQ
jgi:hypothetical protein